VEHAFGGAVAQREVFMTGLTVSPRLRHAAMASMLGLSALACATPSDAAVSFEGQTIRVIIGLRPGGGTDVQGRLIGHFMQKYLPGEPRMVYLNMPGADGLLAINHLAQQTKPDGGHLLVASNSQLSPQVLRSDVVKYDAATLAYVGATSQNGSVLLMRRDALPKLTDKSKEAVVVADVDGTRAGVQMAVWGHLYLGWNLRWVFGYSSASDMLMAVERGEADLTATANINPIKEMISKDGVMALVQRGRFSDGKFRVRKDLENVPVLSDLLEGKLDPQAEETFNVWAQSTNIGKWLTLASGTPRDIVQAYRDAFDKVGEDPEFISIGQKQIDAEFGLINGQDLEVIGKQMANASPASLKALDGLNETILSLRHSSGDAKKTAAAPAGVKTTLTDVQNDGRELSFEAGGKRETVRVSSGATTITVSGEKAERGALKPGMACEITYSGTAVSIVACQ
jgi:tripartite-type tricarboxylate transporter receptor subunit TctC